MYLLSRVFPQRQATRVWRLRLQELFEMKNQLHQAINNAIMKEFMFQGYNKHQALHAILELTEEPEAIKETLHGALDKYIDYKKSYRIEL